jgi:hypothetical protein
MLSEVWAFLRDPANLKVLSWLGGGVTVVAGGAWAVFRFFLSGGDGAKGGGGDPGQPSAEAKLADTIVNKIFEGPRKPAEPALMAPGLAVGYFFNFLEPIAKQLEIGGIRLSERANATADDGSWLDFDLASTTIQIIVPARLSDESFQRCEEEFKQCLKGTIFLPAQKRYYGINYRVFDTGSDKRLTIVDLARPAMVLKRCYQDMVKTIDTDPDSQDDRWRGLQQVELAAFEKTLRKMQTLGFGVLTNRLDVVRRG